MICLPVVHRFLACAILLEALVMALPAAAQQPTDEKQVAQALSQLAWQRGPREVQLGTIATLQVPESQAFLDGPNTRRFLELNGNPPRDGRYALVAQDLSWFAIFFFEDTGYVRDDERLDPDALLESLKANDKEGNEERKRLGMQALHTAGWHVPPHYDQATKRLEWGLRLRGEDGSTTVNYTIRILGRRGVMHAILVSEPKNLDLDTAQFKASLAAHKFVQGERYTEFRAGDRVAEYGLAALVLGGAAAVAAKTGFFKAFGKVLVVGLLAAGGALVALFRRLFRRS